LRMDAGFGWSGVVVAVVEPRIRRKGRILSCGDF
jgi:hypothetical protein